MRRLVKWLIIAILISVAGFGFYALKTWDRLPPELDFKFFLADVYYRLEDIFINQEEAFLREKKIIWCANECFWLDNDGQAFESALETEGDLVPLVVELSDRELKLRSEIISKDQTIYLSEIINFLKIADISFNRIEVGDLSGEDAWVEINQGPIIYFSLRFSPMFGLGVVKSLKESGEWENIRYIDLRAENKVFYMP